MAASPENSSVVALDWADKALGHTNLGPKFTTTACYVSYDLSSDPLLVIPYAALHTRHIYAFHKGGEVCVFFPNF